MRPQYKICSWNVLTPFYNKDVTYSKSDLEKRSDALGVLTLLYLQTLYRADWNNFLERMGIMDEEKIFSKKYIDETRRSGIQCFGSVVVGGVVVGAVAVGWCCRSWRCCSRRCVLENAVL